MPKPKAPETALANIAPLQAALALATEAGDINALKDVAAMAAALQKGARSRGMGIESENTAAEVVLRAERAIGSLIRELHKAGALGPVGGRRADGSPRTAEDVGRLRLQDIGINEPMSHNFKRLADLPGSVFESAFARIRDSGARIAKVDFYRLAKQTDKVKAEAVAGIRAEVHAEDDTKAFVAFEKAAGAVIKGIDQLPDDELVRVAGIIKRLAEAYNAEKAARA